MLLNAHWLYMTIMKDIEQRFLGRLSFWNNDNSSFLKESLGSERLNVSYPSIQ